MNKVTVRKDEFIQRVQANRDKHRATFEKALEGYKALMLRELEHRIHDLKRGRRIDRYIRLDEPEDHTDDYDRVLEMARMSVEDTIDLTGQDFAMYVMDQWSWKHDFEATTAMYIR